MQSDLFKKAMFFDARVLKHNSAEYEVVLSLWRDAYLGNDRYFYDATDLFSEYEDGDFLECYPHLGQWLLDNLQKTFHEEKYETLLIHWWW